jgi:hypothetical protein
MKAAVMRKVDTGTVGTRFPSFSNGEISMLAGLLDMMTALFADLLLRLCRGNDVVRVEVNKAIKKISKPEVPMKRPSLAISLREHSS